LQRRKTRTRRLELGAALSAALCLSACGGAKQSAPPPPPTFGRSLASSLAEESEAVAAALAAGNSCRALALARLLQQRTIAAINDGKVAAGLQEQLSGAVNELVIRVRCVPPVGTTAPPPTTPDHGEQKGHEKRREKKHGKGHGKKRHEKDD
jgi:hypothetical protein